MLVVNVIRATHKLQWSIVTNVTGLSHWYLNVKKSPDLLVLSVLDICFVDPDLKLYGAS